MKKNILICNSNMFVPYVLTECLEKKDCKFIVASDTVNIIQFFDFLKLDNVELYKYKTGSFSVIRQEKKKMKAYLLCSNIDRIVFYHAEFGEMANWLLKKLSKIGISVEYHKVFDSIPGPMAKIYKGFKIRVRQRLFFGYSPDILDQGSRLIPSLPKSFFKSINAKVIIPKTNDNLIKEILKKTIDKLEIKGRVLFVSGSVVAENYVSECEYTNKMDKLIDIVGIDRAAIKLHPRYNDAFGKELSLNQIPKFIPGNVLLDVFDVYIGYLSTLLVEAAHKGKTVISTLHLLEPNSETAQQRFQELLDNRLGDKGIIFYPNTIEEFKKYLSI